MDTQEANKMSLSYQDIYKIFWYIFHPFFLLFHMYDISKKKDLIPAYHSYMAKGGTEFWEMMDMLLALMVIMV